MKISFCGQHGKEGVGLHRFLDFWACWLSLPLSHSTKVKGGKKHIFIGFSIITYPAIGVPPWKASLPRPWMRSWSKSSSRGVSGSGRWP